MTNIYKNIYKYEFQVTCPHDIEQSINYLLIIKHRRTIGAEEIVDACDIKGPMFQEEIADRIAALLPGKQKIVANHCGVNVITKRCDDAQ